MATGVLFNPTSKTVIATRNSGIDYTKAHVSSATHVAADFPEPLAVTSITNPGYINRNLRTVTTGIVENEYEEIFYNRVRLNPTIVDAGNVAGAQTYQIKLFNSYFTPSTLNNIIPTNAEGLELTGDPFPDVYLPLEEKTYTLTILPNGPGIIDAQFSFDFPNPIVDVVLTVTGSRIVLIPYRGLADVNEELEWLTDIIVMRDGKEQTISLRSAPRQTVEYKGYLPLSGFRKINNILYGWRANTWTFPLWSEARNLTAPAAAGATVINCSTLYGAFRVGGSAFVWESETKYEVVPIFSMTSTSITSSRALTNSFTTAAIVMPARQAMLAADPIRLTSGYNAYIAGSFQVLDNVDIGPPAAAVTYLGYEVWLQEPIAEDRMTETYTTQMDIFDNSTGVIDFGSSWLTPKITRNIDLICEGQQAIWEMKQFLARRRGRAVPFWMLTHEDDMRLLTTGTIVASFTIVDDGQAGLAPERIHIGIKTASGWIYRTCVGITLGAPGEITVSLDTAINIAASTILQISYLGLRRLDSDRVTFHWHQNNVATVSFNTVEVSP